MHVSDQGLKLIQLFESCRLTPYADSVGIWTVGWGHALTDPSGNQIKDHALVGAAMTAIFGNPSSCTQAQADALLHTDLAVFEAWVTGHADSPTQAQFDALTSITFNIGRGNMATTTLLKMHNAGSRNIPPFDMATLALKGKAHALSTPRDIGQAFAAWSNTGGQWSLGVFRRRCCEAMVYRGDDVNQSYQLVEAFRG